MKQLNIGIIGAGRIGKVHMQSITYNVPTAKVLGITDVFKDGLQELADKYGIEKSKLSENNKARWNSSAEYIQLYYEYFEKCHKEGKDTQLYETCGLMWELDKLKKQKKA